MGLFVSLVAARPATRKRLTPAAHGAVDVDLDARRAGVYLVAQALAIQSIGGQVLNARCFFDSRAGTGTIPAAVLSNVQVGQQFYLLTATAAVAQADAQKVTVWLVGEALTPDKKNDVALDVQ